MKTDWEQYMTVKDRERRKAKLVTLWGILAVLIAFSGTKLYVDSIPTDNPRFYAPEGTIYYDDSGTGSLMITSAGSSGAITFTSTCTDADAIQIEASSSGIRISNWDTTPPIGRDRPITTEDIIFTEQPKK